MGLDPRLLDGGKRGRRRDGARSEIEIMQAILQFLSTRRIFAWRVNTGGAWLPGKGNELRVVRFGKRGMPDVQGVVRGSGRALFIEVKRPGERPSPHQQMMLRLLSDYQALAFVATSVEDVVRRLDQEGIR